MIVGKVRTRATSLLKRWEESAISCAGDLRTLSTRSAPWEAMDREQIAVHAAREIADTMELEFAAVQLNDASGVEIFQHGAPLDGSSELSAALLQVVRNLDREAYPWPTGGVFDWHDPSGGPIVRIVRIPIGIRDDGWVFAGSVTKDFPGDPKVVILVACANQIAVAIQIWRDRDARRDEREHFRRFSQNSPDALWIIKINTMQIEYLSPAFKRIWGKPPAEMLGDIKNWSDTICLSDRSSVANALDAAVRGEVVAPNYSIILPKLATRQIRHVLFPIRDEQGRVTHVGGAAEDVTATADIQVYVLSSDVASREHVALVLRTNGFAVKLFTSSRVFLEAASVLVPGCLIIERRGTETKGLRIVSELRARSIDLPVIIVDKSRGGVAAAVNAMKAGATDWLEAPYEEVELVAAVGSALASIEILRNADHATKLARSRLAEMTPRERQVLLGLVAGETNKEIARQLGISPRTVENHRAHVMERLGARTLSEAVLLAASTGLVWARTSK